MAKGKREEKKNVKSGGVIFVCLVIGSFQCNLSDSALLFALNNILLC